MRRGARRPRRLPLEERAARMICATLHIEAGGCVCEKTGAPASCSRCVYAAKRVIALVAMEEVPAR